MKTTIKTENRFETDASRYAAYLESPEGRLRGDLTFANLQDFLPVVSATRELRALDLGCGTGVASIRLARLGVKVTLLDSSAQMLELAERASAEAGVKDKITIKHGDASELAATFRTERFDIILCHNLLEYVDDPAAILQRVVGVMRDSSAILSVLVRSQAGEALKAALQASDLAAAEHNLTAEWGQESLYGGKVRLFTPETLEAMLQDASIAHVARRGVRVIADYLPAQISRSAEYERIFALERKLGKRQEFYGIARYMHALGRYVGASTGGDK
ncbi:MAG TPA: methyltransferase domain-containing protein [Candidatus Angelobacter sp.]